MDERRRTGGCGKSGRAIHARSRGTYGAAAHLRTALASDRALEMAVKQRRPAAVIHHSDQGCQYTSLAFGARSNPRAGSRPARRRRLASSPETREGHDGTRAQGPPPPSRGGQPP